VFRPDDEVDHHGEELVDDPKDSEARGGDGATARHAEERDGEPKHAGEENRQPHLEREPVEGGVRGLRPHLNPLAHDEEFDGEEEERFEVCTGLVPRC